MDLFDGQPELEQRRSSDGVNHDAFYACPMVLETHIHSRLAMSLEANRPNKVGGTK